MLTRSSIRPRRKHMTTDQKVSGFPPLVDDKVTQKKELTTR